MSEAAPVAPKIDHRAAMVDRPGVVLRFLYARLFDSISFDEADVAKVRAAAARGPVVYVLPSVSYMIYLYFGYALRRFGLPLARFANGGVRTVLLWPLHITVRLLLALWRLARGARLEPEEDTMARLVGEEGGAVLLFLRPAKILVEEPGEAARVRGHFFERLVAIGRARAAAGLAPLQIVPMTLLLGHPAVRRAGARGEGPGAWGSIFGEPEAPGRLRAFFQFVWHRHTSQVKVAEPLDLATFLAEAGEHTDDTLARMLRFEVSGAIERERRVVMGPPVKSARRVRTDVLRSRRLVKAVDELCQAPGAPPRAELVARARRDLGRIAAYPRRWAFSFMRRLLALVFERMYEGIDIDEAGLERVREATRGGPLLLLPSHKSHVDYLILSYTFYTRGLAPPHIAAGDNLSFFPLGFLFRRTAAFFLRRSFKGDALYAAVFDAYVRRLLRDGFSVEFFIEGGRSRTGKVLPPKLGLLSICADAVLDGDAPTTQVVPIALSYEKIVEEKSYQKEVAGGAKKKEGLGALLGARKVLSARYGRIDLQFGTPFSLRQALAQAGAHGPEAGPDARRLAVQRLGHRVVYEIAAATAVMPSALVAAAALAGTARGLPRSELERRIRFLYARAKEGGARFSAAILDDLDGAVAASIARLGSAGDLDLRGHGDDPVVVVPSERRSKLEFYKNNLIHALADLSIVARAVVAVGAGGGELAKIKKRAQSASQLLKRELIFRPGKGFDRAFAETVAWLERQELVGASGDRLEVLPAGREWLPILAGLTGSTLDAYGLVVRAAILADDKGRKDKKTLVSRAFALGERSLLLGELERAEALSRPVLDAAWDTLREVGAIETPARLGEIERELESVRTARAARAVTAV
jgi:glycerol-3-phosphate O-acyltransferase